MCVLRHHFGLAKVEPGWPARGHGRVTEQVCVPAGCTGALAHELAHEYPRMRVTVFDLPDVLEHVACFQPGGRPSEQISFVPGARCFVFAERRRSADRMGFYGVCVQGVGVRVFWECEHGCICVCAHAVTCVGDGSVCVWACACVCLCMHMCAWARLCGVPVRAYDTCVLYV